MVYKIGHLSNTVKQLIYKTVFGYKHSDIDNVSSITKQKHIGEYGGEGNLLDLLKEKNIPLVWDISEESEEFLESINAGSWSCSARIENNSLCYSSEFSNNFKSSHTFCEDNSILQSKNEAMIKDSPKSQFRDIKITLDQYLTVKKEIQVCREWRQKINEHVNLLVDLEGVLPATFWEELYNSVDNITVEKIEKILIKLELPEKGSLVYVRDYDDVCWRAAYFVDYVDNFYKVTFDNEESSWRYMTTNLPKYES